MFFLPSLLLSRVCLSAGRRGPTHGVQNVTTSSWDRLTTMACWRWLAWRAWYTWDRSRVVFEVPCASPRADMSVLLITLWLLLLLLDYYYHLRILCRVQQNGNNSIFCTTQGTAELCKLIHIVFGWKEIDYGTLLASLLTGDQWLSKIQSTFRDHNLPIPKILT